MRGREREGVREGGGERERGRGQGRGMVGVSKGGVPPCSRILFCTCSMVAPDAFRLTMR
jgi:hypothetical protein